MQGPYRTVAAVAVGPRRIPRTVVRAVPTAGVDRRSAPRAGIAPGRPAVAEITDDTQMTLFTAEGLLRATGRWHDRGICHPPTVVHDLVHGAALDDAIAAARAELRRRPGADECLAAIPAAWLERLEPRDVIAAVAEEPYARWRDDDAWGERYPRW